MISNIQLSAHRYLISKISNIQGNKKILSPLFIWKWKTFFVFWNSNELFLESIPIWWINMHYCNTKFAIFCCFFWPVSDTRMLIIRHQIYQYINFYWVDGSNKRLWSAPHAFLILDSWKVFWMPPNVASFQTFIMNQMFVKLILAFLFCGIHLNVRAGNFKCYFWTWMKI